MIRVGIAGLPVTPRGIDPRNFSPASGITLFTK